MQFSFQPVYLVVQLTDAYLSEVSCPVKKNNNNNNERKIDEVTRRMCGRSVPDDDDVAYGSGFGRPLSS